ncbi:MAG: hypothetical protein IT158_26635 [Bryobacterales bacterium]|nr:hypothetical protein [Bryobacterales bacterium]
MRQVFEMIPPAGSPFTLVLAGTLLLLGGTFALFLYMAYSSRRVSFEVSPEELKIRGGLYGRTVQREELVMDRARPVDLQTEREYGLSWRTNGIGLPGYKAGWFKLRNGEKALVFVTDAHRVAYIPTRRNYSLLLSVASPPQFLDALKGSPGSK